MKIIHFTTVHPRDDVRVFYKQCTSLVLLGNEVTLIVADGLGNEIKNGVEIIDIGNYRTQRAKRLFEAQKILKTKLTSLDADIYQFHDPELLSVGKWLKKKGKKVVFDSHEDVPKQLLYKSWLGPLFLRKIISKRYNSYEKKAVQQLDGLISVIDEITEKFNHRNSLTLRNFPILSEIEKLVQPIEARKKQILYLGSLSKVRGVKDYIDAMQFVPKDYTLVLIGSFSSSEFENECRQSPNWDRVNYLGFKPMNEALVLLAESYIALSVLHPEKNYLTSLPTKGFEYMAAGIPTIISNFEYWKPFFQDSMIMIAPKKPLLLAEKINLLIKDKTLYEQLVLSAQENVKQYSWESEAKKLVEFYETILNQ